MLRLSLFRLGLFRSANLITFASAAGFLGGLFVYPLMLQTAFGYSPLTAGLLTFPEAIGIMVGTQIAARFYGRVGPRRLIAAGQATVAIALLCLAFVMSSTISPVVPVALMLLLGIRAGAHLHAHPGLRLRHGRPGAHRRRHRAVQRHPPGRFGGRRGGGRHRHRHHRVRSRVGGRRERGTVPVPDGLGRLRVVLGGRFADRHLRRQGRRRGPQQGARAGHPCAARPTDCVGPGPQRAGADPSDAGNSFHVGDVVLARVDQNQRCNRGDRRR